MYSKGTQTRTPRLVIKLNGLKRSHHFSKMVKLEVTGQILFLEEDNFLNGLFKRFEIDAEAPFYRC